ncbi:transcriptional Coactivator p15-domain-containing protein [Russula compacta]|nr:transcriptional Coactivator p15-domain-containing protein [Russula compacta]
MERPVKSSKRSSENGGSKRSSKSRKSTDQVHYQPHSRRRAVHSHSFPLQKSKDSSKRKATEQEVSDGGESAHSAAEPRRPATNTVKKPRISLQSGEDNTDSEDPRVKLQTNGEGDQYVDLGKKKRVTVRSFKGTTLVDIREYYGEEGDEKPGKKGISLTVEQWKSLVQTSSAINSLL